LIFFFGKQNFFSDIKKKSEERERELIEVLCGIPWDEGISSSPGAAFLYTYVQIRRRFRLTLSSRRKRRNGRRETRDALKTVEEEVEVEVEVEEVEEEK
jgi:hypothetical protein